MNGTISRLPKVCPEPLADLVPRASAIPYYTAVRAETLKITILGAESAQGNAWPRMRQMAVPS